MPAPIFQPYEPNSGSLLALMRDQTNARADAIERGASIRALAMHQQGQNSAAFLTGLGQVAARGFEGAVSAHQQQKQQQQEQANEEWLVAHVSESKQPPVGELIARFGETRASDILGMFQKLDDASLADQKRTADLMAADLRGVLALPAGMRPTTWNGIKQRWEGVGAPAEWFGEQYDDQIPTALLAKLGQKAPEPPKLIQRDPEKDLVNEQTGAVVTPGAPKPTEPKLYPVVTFGKNGRPVRKLATEEELRAGIPEYEAPKTGSQQRFWVFRDGKAIRVNDDEYRIGDLPGNTREQGRPVISGDANRIADYDTSLDDINALRSVVAPKIGPDGKALPGPTGTGAAIGAGLPKWVTDLTGWGTDAKKKQAVIDRVKQVIGKALEGGVLRKEDEYKYTKILPTIGDPSDVVATKIEGLWDAITLRRQTLLDALGDAGYDVTKFNAREPRKPTTEDERENNGQPFAVKAPDGQTYTFPTKAKMEAFKLRAGIR